MNKNITQKVGALPVSDGTLMVSLWAPLTKSVHLKVKGEKALTELKKKPFGYWQAEVKNLAAGDYYKFLLDEELERPDPASQFQPEGVHSWSEVVDHSEYVWNDGTWTPPIMENMIIYELHVGTFTPEGTFEALTDKLDHLLELGINTIELMPIAQFPGERNWGYDGVYPFATQNSYGTVEKLKQMVDKCHQKGIAVILDAVYNHMGPEGNYLSDFGPYFTKKYNTPWGSAINFDDQYSGHVRSFFLQNALMWLEDFHFDGLRLDAVHAILDNGPVHFLKELSISVDQLGEKTGKNYILIAESDMNDTKVISGYRNGGYGLEAQWTDDFHHAVHTLATGEKEGYYEDYGDIHQLAKSFSQAFIYDGIYSQHRKKKVGTLPESIPPHQFVVCIQNHDQVGNRMLGDRLSRLVSFEMLKLTAGVLLSSPFVPMLFMGEEYGEEQPFQYFVNHGDPALVKAVQEGRKKEFEHFSWEGDVPDPQSEKTFERSKLNWDFKNDVSKTILFNYYRQLILLRKQSAFAPFKEPDREITVHAKEKTLTVFGQKGKEKILAIFNFSHTDQNITLPQNELFWTKILSSSDPKWGGTRDIPDHPGKGGEIIISSSSLIIYK